ncbi:WXG100 family type VII secretion target [Streptomyces sp. NPDC048484]|uniref:WXG100 family type VII secretion target n=1 Tax=Streptomyces sp. NPDC048484 TaxID=3155146 RepID=UPI00344AE411
MAGDPGEMLVTYDALDRAATTLGDEAKKLENDLGEIKRMVARVAAGWEGDAHQMYTEQQTAWDKEANDIHQALVGIARVVGQAGGDYMGGDKKAASYYL